MRYEKQPLDFEDQADLLIGRGLAADRDILIQRMKAVGYYRLSGYLYPFRQTDASGKRLEDFIPGTSLDVIWRRYNFDRRLRMLVMDAIERIEVAVRTRLVHHYVMLHGPFGHLDATTLPGFRRTPMWKSLANAWSTRSLQPLFVRSDHSLWLAKLRKEQARAKETFVTHFTTTYGDSHLMLPLWMARELMTCETTQQFMGGLSPRIVDLAARDFDFPEERLRSWVKALFSLRNSCAHHSRTWNRSFGLKPSVPGPRKHPEWNIPWASENDRIGFMLTICHFWLRKISPTTQWKCRFIALLAEYPDIPLKEMGLPKNWESFPIWS